MRRTVLSSITVLSLTALSIVIGACATAPVDDGFEGLTQEQNPAQPPEEQTSAKLPAPTQNTGDPEDAGTETKTPPKDAGAPPKDASTPPADASTPPPATTGGDCDPNDMTYYFKLLLESNPTPCPCSASQCCYMGMACVTK